MLAATELARSLAAVAPEVPPEVVAVVDRALQAEKADRWPNALSLRDAIGAVSATLFGTATPAIVDEAPVSPTVLAPARDAPISHRTELLARPRPSPDVSASAPTDRPAPSVNLTERIVVAPMETPPHPVAPPRSEVGPEDGAGVPRRILRALPAVALVCAAALGIAVIWKLNAPPRPHHSSPSAGPAHAPHVPRQP
jgi:hypothetical protein